MSETQSNSKFRDSSSKIIFEDPTLCAQFLRGYIDIPLLKDVQPEDIEDVTSRYVHLFTEERNSDVVKRVHIRGSGQPRTGRKSNEMPFYLISLIEHKSKVDYNVVMQVLRYMVFIWEDYEKEMEKNQQGISRQKGFRYPPILPIVFCDGQEDWTAATRLHERILLSDVLGKYIPDYRCILMQLKEYSREELMRREDVLSVIMMMAKLHKASEFSDIKREVGPEYLQRVLGDAPEYLLDIVSRIIEALLRRINVPDEEIGEFTEQIKERHMGELFANFEPYDVQATRREARAEGREEGRTEGRKEGREEGVVITVKQLDGTMEMAVQHLVALLGLSEADAQEKVKLYW